ncbi:MAG: hypothetical protein EKK46_13745 [Rhodocyclaceae bacterium]|nr:MAG: hypothetical protein EKK46_13745 [Rhodocyclaceae bacterium]
MSSPLNPEIEIVHESILRGGPHELLLRYKVGAHVLSLNGVDDGHPSGGSINFPSADIWGKELSSKFGSRDDVIASIVSYVEPFPHLGFIADQLLGRARQKTHYRKRRQPIHPFLRAALIGVAVGSAILVLALFGQGVFLQLR